MYFDEDLLLNLRLNTLYDYVDQFVILEAKEDHQGNKRELNFDIKNFGKFSDKIKYISLEKIEIDPKIKMKKNWHSGHLRDNSMRNSIMQHLSSANSEDWIIISDLDEIPNPQKIKSFNPSDKFAFFEQKFFNYKFNILNTSHENWYGSRICVKKYLKSPQWLRNIKIKKRNILKRYLFNLNYKVIKNGGWHFSNIKSPKKIIEKINAFCHGEFNKEKFKNEILIDNKINNLEDIFDRNISYKKVKIDQSFPQYLIKNIDLYSNWIA
jgi:beta-1,4-mannosyl-glycoprotein beta-1,4-N-acetylglucosaminyltransferase